MSLTTEDLQAIRLIVREEVKTEVAAVDSRLQGVENDVKKIYGILIRNKIAVV